ncbi:MAG: hypothetical protein NWE93_05845 [Candidatus Bathyarchaeota archaeon]|nr:hypothetical protein [Candidatus Bathyarchaeota archaeon]
MSKKIALLLVIAVLVVVPLTLALTYKTSHFGPQINDAIASSNATRTPLNDTVTSNNDSVKIIALTPSDHWGNPVGMAMDFWFNVTIRNDDINSVSDLNLNLTITGVPDDIYNWGTSEPIGTIQPGQTSEVQMYVILLHNGYENLSQIAGHKAVINLMLGDKIIDKCSIPL